jgi:hypothetical protein
MDAGTTRSFTATFGTPPSASFAVLCRIELAKVTVRGAGRDSGPADVSGVVKAPQEAAYPAGGRDPDDPPYFVCRPDAPESKGDAWDIAAYMHDLGDFERCRIDAQDAIIAPAGRS